VSVWLQLARMLAEVALDRVVIPALGHDETVALVRARARDRADAIERERFGGK
jgi:hypothetical protein